MQKSIDQIQLLQVSYEISMSIGNSLDLRQMLKHSLSTILKRLNCSVGGVFALNEHRPDHFALEPAYLVPRSITRNATYHAALENLPTEFTAEQLAQYRQELPIIGNDQNGYFYIFELPEFGLLLLVKNGDALSEPLISSLEPLFVKLASSCTACVNDATLRESRAHLEIRSERRTRQMQTGMQVAQQITMAVALDDLFRRVVNLTQAQFGYYQVHVYTLEGETLVMQEGTGQTGHQLKQAGHKIALTTENSLVARAARSGESVLVSMFSQVPDWLPNPLLPDTKSEIAVPIKLGHDVLGVLDVQSNVEGRITDEDDLLLTAMCGQIAAAISNRHAEDALHLTQFSIDIVPQSIFWIGPEGNILNANEGAGLRLGYTQQELRQMTVFDFDLGFARSELAPVWTKMKQQRTMVLESEYQTKSGQRYPVEISMSFLKYGCNEFLFVFATDITERKQADEERERLLVDVRQSREFLRTLIDNIPLPIFYKDLTGAYQGFNKAFMEYIGFAEDELLGKTVYDLNTDKAMADKYHEADMALFRNPQVQVYEAQVKYADGSLRDVIFNKAPFFNTDGDLGGLIGTMVDITQRKQAEQERERLLAEVEATYRQYVRREWDPFLAEQHSGVLHIEYQLPDEDHNQFGDTSRLDVPIALRGQSIGELSLQDVSPERAWTEDELTLVEAVTEQLALTIENLRLFDSAQQRAAREQLTRQITDKMRQSPDIDSIIKTGLSELATALGTSRTYVKLNPGLRQNEH